MAMGTHEAQKPQEELWIPCTALPQGASHPFYHRLNQLLEEKGFDAWVEGRCQRFYAPQLGRPSLAPGMYFRLLLIGYFEGIDSERGMAWRANDSLALRRFLRVGLDEGAPDHSTISRTRRLIDLETHREVFAWVLRVLAENGLLKGETLGIDATTLEANAALRSIVRRDTGEGYQEFLQRLAKESGMATPTRQQLAKLDRRRPRKGSNEEWEHPHDADARIAKMKDGRTHLAHKVEHGVDLESGALVAVTVQPADRGDTETVRATLREAGEAIAQVARETNDGEAGERGAELLLGAGSRAAAVAGEGRGASGGVCEPAADSRGAREGITETAGREDRAELCPLLRNRWPAPPVLAPTSEHPETAAGAWGGVQLGTGDAKDFRPRHPARAARLPHRAVFGSFAPAERGLGIGDELLSRFRRSPTFFRPLAELRALFSRHSQNCHFRHGLLALGRGKRRMVPSCASFGSNSTPL